MAKRTQSRAIQVVRATPVKPQPVTLRIATPRAAPIQKPRRGGKPKRRSSSKSAGGFGYNEKTLLMIGAGGLALGFVEGQSWADFLPDIPVVGKKGAITIAAYLLSRQGIGGSIVRDIAIAGAAVCGYQLGKEGEVSG
jgi:hypothetical protein